MALNIFPSLDSLVSHAMASGYFERVNTHEPKNAPGNGLTAAIWVQQVAPAEGSGLSSTSALVVFQLRIYTNALQAPQDMIDPNMMDAVNALITAYSSDFELDDSCRCIDLLGMAGIPLSAQAGYLDQDGKLFRQYTLTIPLIFDDVWEQVP